MSAHPTQAHCQRVTADVAMAIYRRRNFTLDDLRFSLAMENSVAEEMAGYNVGTLLQICGAYPSQCVTPGKGFVTCQDWLQAIARQVIIKEIQRIVGDEPHYWVQSQEWVFLGGDRRDLKVLPLTKGQQRRYRPCYDFVDLWGGIGGQHVRVSYGLQPDEYVLGCVADLQRANKHVSEAFRRLHLLKLPVAA